MRFGADPKVWRGVKPFLEISQRLENETIVVGKSWNALLPTKVD